MSRPRVVIVGPMGAGKTTVAERLAARWGTTSRDTDHDVEAADGRSISDIFIEDGEAAFRALEREAVLTALGSHTGVLALGGGAVLDAGVRDALRGHRVVFLEVGLADAVRRVGLGSSRPLLLGNVRSRVKSLLDARRPLYQEVATLTVATDGRSADQVAEEIGTAVEASDD